MLIAKLTTNAYSYSQNACIYANLSSLEVHAYVVTAKQALTESPTCPQIFLKIANSSKGLCIAGKPDIHISFLGGVANILSALFMWGCVMRWQKSPR